jgi:hypothetical protein
MMGAYQASRWYWYVGGDQTQAFSSAANAFVPAADAGLTAFIAAGNMPTAIDSLASLQDVLMQAGVVPYGPVDRVQCLIALSDAGLLTAVQNWIATQPERTQLAWAHAPTFRMTDAIIQQGATALGISATQLTQLFAAAAAVTI